MFRIPALEKTMFTVRRVESLLTREIIREYMEPNYEQLNGADAAKCLATKSNASPVKQDICPCFT